MNFKKNHNHYKTERPLYNEEKKSRKFLSKKFSGLLKVQNTMPIKDDLIHCSIVIYKRKNNISNSKEKKRNLSLLDNKTSFPSKKQKNKKSINIRININNNNKKEKFKNKLLTSSCSEKNNFQVGKKSKINSESKYKKLNTEKNDYMKYRCDNSVNIKKSFYNHISMNTNKNSSNYTRTNKIKKKDTKLQKRKYGKIILLNNSNSNNIIKTNQNIELTDNFKDQSNKNKNRIVVYKNILKNDKKRNYSNFTKVEKQKIDTSINKTINMEKINKNKNYSHPKKRNVITDNNKKNNNNISNLRKRKNYLVPSIKVKKKKKENKEQNKEKEEKNRNDNTIYNEENKQLYMSHLIESKQIQYLKDYEKHKNDNKDKLIKNNEKKFRAINDEKIIDKLLSSDEDEEKKETREDFEEINYDKEENNDSDFNSLKISEKNNKFKNLQINENNQSNEYNKYKTNNEEKIIKISDNMVEKVDEEQKNENQNILKDNLNSNEKINDNFRKPKINTLEYIYRINNNIDVNKLITSISHLDTLSKEKEEDKTNEKKSEKNDDNVPESLNSVNILYEKKIIRPKEEINDFMKNNRLKFKNKEIKLRKEKKDEIIKKFINFVELQKKIEENRKIKLINKQMVLKNIPVNKNNRENVKGKTLDEFRLSQNTSDSSTLNMQELYLNIYDAQNIYSSKYINAMMIKNHSMIIDRVHNRKLYNIIKKNDTNKKRSIKSDNNNNKKNRIDKIPKLDKDSLQKIKNVITRLNDFISSCQTKNNNQGKEKKSLIEKYDSILKNVNKLNNFVPEKKKNKSIEIKNYYKKNDNKKSISKNDKIVIIKKQIPTNGKKFKKIPMNEFKKIINHSQNNLNNYELDNSNDINMKSREKKNIKNLNKNHSAIINKSIKYIFTDEQLNKFSEIFNNVFEFLKLFFQKKIFTNIILYTNIKNNYISGFHQMIFLIKKRPFNYLRIIQQREYYQVILRQFYIAYLNRAFNAIKSYTINIQRFIEADNIIKQIYFLNFFKKLLFYIEIKENIINKRIEQDKIIEEEKEEISHDSSSKFENKNINYNKINDEEEEIEIDFNSQNNKKYEIENNSQDNISINNEENESEKKFTVSNERDAINSSVKDNINNNNDNLHEDSFDKENSESYDEIKVITNIFNIIIANISHSPKIYIFDLFKKYYSDSKNKISKNIIDNEQKNLINSFDNEINFINNKQTQIINENNNRKENENSQMNHQINDDECGKNKESIDNKGIEGQKEINKNEPKNFNKQGIIEEMDNNKNLSYEENKNEEIGLFIPYKGEIKKNLMNNIINGNNNNNEEINNNIITNNLNKDDNNEENSFSDKIQKDEFKKYEPNKKNIINEKNEEEDNAKNEEKNNELNNNNINDDNKYKIYSLSNEEINLPMQQSDFINRKKETENNNKDIYNLQETESEKYINCSPLNFAIKNNEIKTNNRYIESEDLFIDDEDFKDNCKNVFGKLGNEIAQKIAEDLTGEIIDNILKSEIRNKKNLLSFKKEIKKNSNSSVASKDSMSGLSSTPSRTNNKLNNSHNKKKNNNNNEIYPISNSNNSGNIQEDEFLNESIFKRTISEIKKDNELNYYDTHIFPVLLKIIENNIKQNYIKIINNLKKPLKKDDEEVMEDIGKLISYDTINNKSIIKYNSRFYNKEIIKNEYIDAKIIKNFNTKLEKESRFYNKYYYEYLNQCIYDTTNELIRSKRIYGNIGEPLLWSLRSRAFDYKYKDSKLFKEMFASNIIEELKKFFFSKIGAIIENSENINISQFSKERDLKFNENIREDLKKENEFENLDEQETIIKITIAKMIMNQLLNEVIEILEHVNYSRKEPEKYNYKSIFSCDNIPLLCFQNVNNKNDNDEEEEEEKSEDIINQ